eukprot:4335966-Ditylum_brightwellii.AAC.1
MSSSSSSFAFDEEFGVSLTGTPDGSSSYPPGESVNEPVLSAAAVCATGLLSEFKGGPLVKHQHFLSAVTKG